MKRIAMILLALVLLAPAAPAEIHCPPGQSCPSQSPAVSTPHPAVVRIAVKGSRFTDYGSGTLIVTDDPRGVVVTCAHLFREQGSTITVIFPDGRRAPALMLTIDRDNDIAVLAIAPPIGVDPIAVAETHARHGERVTASGYGASGRYLAFGGAVVGYSKLKRTGRRETLVIRGMTRGGDSGGPMLNARGLLVGVSWGSIDGRTYGTFCGRLKTILARIGLAGPTTPMRPPPRAGAGAGAGAGVAEQLALLQSRFDELAIAIAAIPAGPAGEQGAPGPRGEKGEPGVLGQAGGVSMDDLTDLVLTRLLGTDDEPGLLPSLPSLPVRQIQMKRDANGEWVEYSETVDKVHFSRGEGITIRLFPPE